MAIAEFVSSICSLHEQIWINLKNDSNLTTIWTTKPPLVHNYNYYLEFPNGSRIRQNVPIKYDDRRGFFFQIKF